MTLLRFTTFFEIAAALASRFCLTLLILVVFVWDFSAVRETECLGGRPRFLRGEEEDVCWRFAMRLGGRVNFILRDGVVGGADGLG